MLHRPGCFDVVTSSLGAAVARRCDALVGLAGTGVVTVVTDDVESAFRPRDVGWVIPFGPDNWMRALGTACCTPNLDGYLREVRGGA